MIRGDCKVEQVCERFKCLKLLNKQRAHSIVAIRTVRNDETRVQFPMSPFRYVVKLNKG